MKLCKKNSTVLQSHSLTGTVLIESRLPLPTNSWLTRKETFAPMGANAYLHIIWHLSHFGGCAPRSQKHPEIVLQKRSDVGKVSQGLSV